MKNKLLILLGLVCAYLFSQFASQYIGALPVLIILCLLPVIYVFWCLKPSWLRTPIKKEIEESDWGRRYGWFVEKDGSVIGSLDYIRWDSHSQFWHDYHFVLDRPDLEILKTN